MKKKKYKRLFGTVINISIWRFVFIIGFEKKKKHRK
jgi:hypothetical protein